MRIFMLSILLLSFTCSAAQNAASQKLPRDAARLVERVTLCRHFSGEFNGDGSAHDKEVNAQMTSLKCDKITDDVKIMQAKYKRNLKVQSVLKEATSEVD
jgi:hypothetical protein